MMRPIWFSWILNHMSLTEKEHGELKNFITWMGKMPQKHHMLIAETTDYREVVYCNSYTGLDTLI